MAVAGLAVRWRICMIGVEHLMIGTVLRLWEYVMDGGGKAGVRRLHHRSIE